MTSDILIKKGLLMVYLQMLLLWSFRNKTNGSLLHAKMEQLKSLILRVKDISANSIMVVS